VSAIEFEAVSYSLPGGIRLFDRFSLGIDDGEVLAIVGRSGAGKTTMLRLVNRLALPDAGRVLVGGRYTRDWDAIRLRRSTGYVIQEGGLFPHMSVADNISVVPRLEGWDAARIAARVSELLALVGLSPSVHADRWPDQLSGGQRQRVGVARALAADPRVLLMDEPFGALDPVTRAELQAEFSRVQRQVRKTVILVTHDMAEALSLSDRVAVLDGGALVACEPPSAIVESSDPRVRALLDAVRLRIGTGPPSS
jgi:osmoprotectant transport system ATP-binding protein